MTDNGHHAEPLAGQIVRAGERGATGAITTVEARRHTAADYALSDAGPGPHR
ncbi:hypothetical protein [Streptosporangium carneum]|uniref:Uncharacterized protein n=1 Tax=Streptosporangium carneum TaxID=47481 RepID=A0A9W6I1C7_9ACTN|nr:hypothetical protein [Streptosporangium carneum]GLK09170.1 hypothetical protein GCM10017600_25760 [Streptosporangium carneum]